MISLYPHQRSAVELLRSGAVLCGGVGSGKSRTSLAYFFEKECCGQLTINDGFMALPKDLYIITTARKRDTLEWAEECSPFFLKPDSNGTTAYGTKVIIDSWNNISHYTDVNGAFFIFDEQRVVGSGSWVKSFLKITKSNRWILLSATPGDTWMDYIPVFIANGFYKNKTEFIRKHVVYNRRVKFPKVDRYIDIKTLEKHRKDILVDMVFERDIERRHMIIPVMYNAVLFKDTMKRRWNPFEDKPIQDISGLCYILRKIVNSDFSRDEAVRVILNDTPKAIIFYSFDYELEQLRKLCRSIGVPFGEWNGKLHEPIPKTDRWVYLVQYTAGAEGWNCIETDTVIFWSQSYSYKAMVQAAGRIDRMNTPFHQLRYFHLISQSPIDIAIRRSLRDKKNFNEHRFIAW